MQKIHAVFMVNECRLVCPPLTCCNKFACSTAPYTHVNVQLTRSYLHLNAAFVCALVCVWLSVCVCVCMCVCVCVRVCFSESRTTDQIQLSAYNTRPNVCFPPYTCSHTTTAVYVLILPTLPKNPEFRPGYLNTQSCQFVRLDYFREILKKERRP